MKKYILTVLCVMVCLICFIGCKKQEESGAPLAPTNTDKDLVNVSYIEVMSGLTGQRIKVKESDSVQKVMNNIKSLTYVKETSVGEVGYAYRIKFYNEKAQIYIHLIQSL